MAADDDQRPRSSSLYDYSDRSVQRAWVAVLVYGGLRALGAIIGGLQQPALAIWFGNDFVIVMLVLGLLAFGISRKSRIAVVLAAAARAQSVTQASREVHPASWRMRPRKLSRRSPKEDCARAASKWDFEFLARWRRLAWVWLRRRLRMPRLAPTKFPRV